MENEKKQRLIDVGIDVSDALNRFMGNENMLERFLGKFLNDQNYSKLIEAFEAEDAAAALTASHTLKGVCGNLSMTELFGLVDAQVKALRNDDYEGAKNMMPKITETYEKIVAVIKD